MNRRDFHFCLAAAATPAIARAVLASGREPGPWVLLERRCQGRLGVAILDADGRTEGHREGERFPMCSTFKWVLAAHVLQRVDHADEQLERRVRYEADALLAYSPVTKAHAGGGMTIAQLCEAAVSSSDNTAANLLLAASGGPPAVTRFARDLGDGVTRLDRIEPMMNESRPGDARDTTSPAAMARLLRAVMTGPALSERSRSLLSQWMEASQTNRNRLGAHPPPGWRVGSKTGTGGRGSTNDVGFFHPPGGGAPLFVAVYITEARAPMAEREAVIAAVAASVTHA